MFRTAELDETRASMLEGREKLPAAALLVAPVVERTVSSTLIDLDRGARDARRARGCGPRAPTTAEAGDEDVVEDKEGAAEGWMEPR